MKIAILVPTLNADDSWHFFWESMKSQNANISKIIILDSGSYNDTISIASKHTSEILYILKSDFSHGLARQILADAAKDCDILIYMTQDAVLFDDNAIANLLKAFDDPQVGIAYGRQLPRQGAKVIEAHARLFNYPELSKVKLLSDRDAMGIKTAFCSNSFAAYRHTLLEDVGGFPTDTIFAEDVYVAAKALMQGWKVAYVADAKVYHSHNYTVFQELQRSFDIGVFHENNKWILDTFGTATNEGFLFVKSEFIYVCKNNILLFPKMVFSIAAKFVGYKLGRNYNRRTHKFCQRLSMNKTYWQKKA